MTYHVGVRHELRGELVCDSTLHVGGWDPSEVADLALMRDGLGLPLLPGTSIAGALRAWLGGLRTPDGRARFPQAVIRQLFGYLVDRTENGAPTWIRVDDAQLIGDPITAVRDGVGIDRRTASAAAGFRYEREVLPVGTRFALRLTADEPSADADPTGGLAPRVAEAFEALTHGLTAGEIPLGASRTKGLGRVRLAGPTTRTAVLSTRHGMLDYLTRSWADSSAPSAPAPQPESTGQYLDVEILWAPLTPLLVRDSLDGVVVDSMPLTETDADGELRLLLPGSSIKGALRAYAERIVRTLSGQRAAERLADVLDQERLAAVAGVFGYSPQRSGTGRRAAADPARRGWRGALEIADCHSVKSIRGTDWAEILTSVPAETSAGGEDSVREDRQRTDEARHRERQAIRSRLGSLPGMSFAIADHVGIDRWTGGAADSLLFSVLEPIATQWQPIKLRLDVRRAAGLVTAPDAHSDGRLAMALLLLLLRDLADGWVPLGSGVTRGQGQITVEQVRFSGTALPAPWSALMGTTLDAVLSDPPQGAQSAMTAWAEHFPAPVDTQESA
jgi:CRISPR/Cas system CSM-associated protein Csm3 (group 7 of RAMP superfamily)